MIKVCGMNRQEDIEYANILKPDYIGFVFANSKRKVSKTMAKKLKSLLDSNIKTVGIFVNEDINSVIDIANIVDLDVIQLHGDEDKSYIEKLKNLMKTNKKDFEIWKAIRVKDKKSLDLLSNLEVDGFLLDTYSNKAYGGLGETFNWDLVSDLSFSNKLILAGGLNSENIREAKNIVNPHIIDVSSGVETEGIKDFEKMKRFIERGR